MVAKRGDVRRAASLDSRRAFVVAKREGVGSRCDIRIAQGEDLAVGHRRDRAASMNTPLTWPLRRWRDGYGRDRGGSGDWLGASGRIAVIGKGG